MFLILKFCIFLLCDICLKSATTAPLNCSATRLVVALEDKATVIKHTEAFTQRCISRWSVTLYARYSDIPQNKSKLAPLQVDPQLFFLHKKGTNCDLF
ncbi:hypothetical protein GLYMA_11G040502v4 [Glycine max]|nr:hypothetical protein GLYMA_11G040502v4 [Glycine max]KAH1157514.1 hypothetical protein GYH30_029971 [Glycine max]